MFDNVDEDVKKMRTPPPVSSHKFQECLIQGLLENKQEVVVINIPRVRYYPHYPQIVFRQKRFGYGPVADGVSIGFINLPVLNYISQGIMLKRNLKSMIVDDGEYVLIAFNNYLPLNRAMIDIRAVFNNVRICNVLGDLHGKYGVKFSSRYHGLKGKLVKRIEASQDWLSAKSDAFGFLTNAMAEALGVNEKPYVVIEGMYSGAVPPFENTNSNEKTILYAGAVEEEYGILHLLRAFAMVDDANYRLLIAGAGGAVDRVRQYALHDGRVSYLGYLSPDEVRWHQADATCLVNPRTSDYDYVKYSFPSKNMECLASGKPFVAHFLPCYPIEYKRYIQCPSDETDNALARELVRVCSLSASERNAIGKAAQDFIVNEKNPKVQCKKIVDMMEAYKGRKVC